MRQILDFKLSRGLPCMSWHKINLYNVHAKRNLPEAMRMTQFQQMWQAKKLTRAYHDAQFTEWKFLRQLFRRRLPTVIGQPSTSTSSTSSSSSSSSSSSAAASNSGREPMSIPSAAPLMYMNMERRLDFILFRSHFAQSVFKARKIVLGGHVSVNGKPIDDPNFQVKDGDVVQVRPSAVCTLQGEYGSELKFAPLKYQQPWMFLPEYLEVDYNICSVVFLRDPVVKAGHCELPSPYPPNLHALAYEYYVRRGKKSVGL